MTDTDRLDFLARTGADTGKRDNVHFCLVPGWHGGVLCIIASGHDPDLRKAIDGAAERYAKYERSEAA